MADERKVPTASEESGRRGPEPADGLDRLEGRIVYVSSDDIVADAKQIIDNAQRVAHQAINITLVQRNWLLGRRIAQAVIRVAHQQHSPQHPPPVCCLRAWSLPNEPPVPSAAMPLMGETERLGGIMYV